MTDFAEFLFLFFFTISDDSLCPSDLFFCGHCRIGLVLSVSSETLGMVGVGFYRLLH